MKSSNKFNQFQKQERRENESEAKFGESFPEHIKDTKPQSQEAQQIRRETSENSIT